MSFSKINFTFIPNLKATVFKVFTAVIQDVFQDKNIPDVFLMHEAILHPLLTASVVVVVFVLSH